jgi:AcrR family transcriptional regulator
MPRPAWKQRAAPASPQTLYRLIPTKAALFEGMVSDARPLRPEVSLRAADHTDIEEALSAALMACAELTLDEEVIALQRIVLQEAGKRSDIAATFYEKAIQRTVEALADWLRLQKQRGLIALDDAGEAAGMLLGMLTSAPRRAAMFGGLPLPSRLEIEARVRRCAALFLRGCQVGKRNSRLLK